MIGGLQMPKISKIKKEPKILPGMLVEFVIPRHVFDMYVVLGKLTNDGLDTLMNRALQEWAEDELS